MMSLRVFHRGTAVVIAGFVIMHLANHLLSLHSLVAHIAFMKVARTVYRHPAIEFVLLVSVIFQCGSGLWMVVRGWSARQRAVAWLQATSGGYLAVFLLIHVSAIMLGRIALHLDTNFYFAAAGFHVPPSIWSSSPTTCWPPSRCSRMSDAPAIGRWAGARPGYATWP